MGNCLESCLMIVVSNSGKFSRKWLSTKPYNEWLVCGTDGAYCKFCVLASCLAPESEEERVKRNFVGKAMNKFSKFKEKADQHQMSQLHRDSVAIVLPILKPEERSAPKPGTLPYMVRNAGLDRKKKNMAWLKSIVDLVLFLGRQGLALRGHTELNIRELKQAVEERRPLEQNHGNFQALLHWLSTSDTNLQQLRDLLLDAPGNATYISPEIQNELLDVAGEVVVGMVLQKLRRAPFYAVMADEVQDCSDAEQLAVCLRFYDFEKREPNEAFLIFQRLVTADAESIADSIWKRSLLPYDLSPTEKLIAQSYDGASVMSGNKTGVHTRISSLCGRKVPFMHCCNHRLNLVIVESLYSDDTKALLNTVSFVDTVALFFEDQPKRCAVFDKYIKECNITDGQTHLSTLCKTRWVERIDGMTAFLHLLKPLKQTLEDISDWKKKSADSPAVKAAGLLATLLKFETLICCCLLTQLLGTVKDVTVKLQGRNIDILTAHIKITALINELEELRDQKCEQWQDMILKSALGYKNMIDGDEPRIPRRPPRQMNGGM